MKEVVIYHWSHGDDNRDTTVQEMKDGQGWIGPGDKPSIIFSAEYELFRTNITDKKAAWRILKDNLNEFKLKEPYGDLNCYTNEDI